MLKYNKGCDKVKYCMSCRQPDRVLRQADEIKFELRDFRALSEYVEKFPNKTFILEMDKDIPKDFDWNKIENYAKIVDFYVALYDLGHIPECSLRNIKYYYKYQINTFYELQGLKDLGVSYVLIGAPLTHDLWAAKSIGVPLRMMPNIAYLPYIKHSDGIEGSWVRPEDVDKYDQYIAAFEFYAPNNLKKEAALYRIYAEDKSWPGNLSLLIDYLEVDANNQIIYDEENFAKRRMNCGQICQKGKHCRFCYNQLIESPKLVELYREYKSNI